MTDDTASRADFAGIHALSSRAAGYSVAAKCLEVQAEAERVDPSLRTDDGVTLHPDARSWFTGAVGEMRVGKMLEALGPEWFVRHAVPIGARTKDVDHLVIGPGGVFSINTKHHAGASIWVGDHAIRVNNFDDHYGNQSARDGADVARRLTAKTGFPVVVTPTLAFLDPKSITDRSSAAERRISAVEASRLVAWLRSRPRAYSDTELALIKIAAEEPETWHVDPRAADTLRVMHRFERLVAQVGTPAPPVTASTAGENRGVRGKRAASVAPSRSRAASGSRSPYRAPDRGPNRTPRRPTRPTPKGKKATIRDVVGLWFTIALAVAGVLVFRHFANQPCTSPIGCFVPMFYVVLKPMLVFGTAAFVGFGALATLVWMVRRARN
jgi:hypothetical protein